MAIKEQLLQEIEETPEHILEEVLNFLLFIKQREQQSLEHQQATNSEQSEKQATGQWLVELAKKIEAATPPEELAKMPSDGAEQHDHYIYGTPKRLTT